MQVGGENPKTDMIQEAEGRGEKDEPLRAVSPEGNRARGLSRNAKMTARTPGSLSYPSIDSNRAGYGGSMSGPHGPTVSQKKKGSGEPRKEKSGQELPHPLLNPQK